MNSHSKWRIRMHVLSFAAGIFAGPFLWSVMVPAAAWLDIAMVHDEQSIMRYGATALLIVCLLYGTLFFSVSAAIAKRFTAEPKRWWSAIAGCIYSLVAFATANFVPMVPGALGAVFFVGWIIVLPGLAVATNAVLMKRMNHSFRGDTGQAEPPSQRY